MFVITGGAGFIGSNLIIGLNRIGVDDILVVDNLKNPEKLKNLNSLNFSDYLDKKAFIQNLCKFKSGKIEVIFHQGACSNTMETDGHYMMENNYEYSKIVLNFCLENKIRLIYASSASVYGNGENGFREERNCENPLNIYAFSKFLFDQYVRRIMPKSKIQIVGLRYFNVYGPQENHKGRMASSINHFYNEIKGKNEMHLFEGSKNFLRDFVYVKDVINVNLFFLKNPEKNGIFNCGSGNAESFLKVGEIMKKLYPSSVIKEIPFPDELKGKYQTFTQADISSLRRAGYNNEFTSLEDGIKAYVKILEESGGYFKYGQIY